MELDRWYRKLEAFREVIKFIDHNHLDQTTVLKNASIFEIFIDRYYPQCQVLVHDHNQTLKDCRQTNPGYYYELKHQDKMVTLVLTPCLHRLIAINADVIKDKFWYYDFAEELLKLDITNPSSINVDPKRHNVLKQLANFNLLNAHQGFYLYGPAGVGKTYISIAFAVYLVKKFTPPKKIAFINSAHLINHLRSNIKRHNPDQKPHLDLMLVLKSADVLFIDDFGVNRWTDWVRSDVYYYLLNYFLINKKILFLNSNLSPVELKEFLNADRPQSKLHQLQTNRIISRIKRLTRSIAIG